MSGRAEFLIGPLAVWYLLASTITLCVYLNDKLAAKRKGQRVRERSLHLLALLGGWPGALLAQHAVRHKVSKASFMAGFWFVTILNIACAAALSWTAMNWSQ